MELKNFEAVAAGTPEETKHYVGLSMDILDRIHELLNEKFEGRQRELAKAMGKKEAEVSKWLNGTQNFTIKTLARLEAAFGAPIISVCFNKESAHGHPSKRTSNHRRA